MMAFTRPEASVAALWQWIHPCVWTILEMPGAGASNGQAELFQIGNDQVYVLFVGRQKLDVVAAREPQVAVTMLVGDIADIADEVDADKSRRTGSNRSRPYRRSLPRASARRAAVSHGTSMFRNSS